MSAVSFLSPRDFLCKKYVTASKLDVIIFGATGYMGQHTVLEAVTVLRDYSWGIAGRNRKKLEALLKDVGRRTSTKLSKIPIFIADVEDPISLADLVIRCHVIVNCCGPYQWLGEPVIKACLDAGTHYVDLSMEAHNTELMQLRYQDEAEEKNVYIISACGWESMPAEMGINFIMSKFNGTINYIESYMEYWTVGNSVIMPVGTKGAWTSMVLACANLREIQAIRGQLHMDNMPELEPKSSYRGVFHESKVVPRVCVPFPVIDQQVVEHSQHYFYEKQKKRPIQFTNYLAFSSHLLAVIFFVWGCIITILAQLPFTRYFLLKFPRLFSFGFFSDRGPDDGKAEKLFFKITLRAVGWGRTAKRPTYQFEEEPNKKMTITITGYNPVNGVACVCLLTSAITIIDECGKMPESGGFYTPGAAFANTNIIEVLEQYDHGLAFEIVEQ